MKSLCLILLVLVYGCADNGQKLPAEIPANSAVIEGEELFKSNCAACHKPDTDFVAPALKGSLERWGGDKKAMYAFIRNPSESISENAYARKLVEKWQVMMTPFNLSDEEIEAIMQYCKNYKSHPIED